MTQGTLSKDIGVKLRKIEDVRRKADDGSDIPYPTLAYAQIMIESPFGDLLSHGYRVLEGKDKKPFVARPGKSRKIYDRGGREIGTQRFNDLRIEGEGDREFDKALKDKILKAYNS